MMWEVYRNGEPTKRLFLSIENAELWIKKQHDGAEYTIQDYKQ